MSDRAAEDFTAVIVHQIALFAIGALPEMVEDQLGPTRLSEYQWRAELIAELLTESEDSEFSRWAEHFARIMRAMPRPDPAQEPSESDDAALRQLLVANFVAGYMACDALYHKALNDPEGFNGLAPKVKLALAASLNQPHAVKGILTDLAASLS